MTNERNQSLSNNFRRSEELPIMRRCRSLSELPGHLRVPILQRKDTERTKARLEAGAAGVKELRALREQQQELIDQAMAAAQPKWKQPTLQRHGNSLTDHHRMQQYHKVEQQRQQVNNSFSTSLSAWHSACSLASISEEWDQTLNLSTNTMGHSVKDQKTTQLRKSYQKRNEVIQSENFYRSRSQSVHGDFPYSADKNGNEFEQTASSPNGLRCSDNKVSQDNDISQSIDVGIKDRRRRANSLDLCTNIDTNISQKDDQILSPRYSLRVKSQSMSWDNLLAVIGLQGENNATTNESMEQDTEKSDDVFTNDIAVSHENTHFPASLDDEYSQRKKMRSQSFTSGCSMYKDSNYRPLTTKILPQSNQKRTDNASSIGNIMDENVQSETVQGHFYNQNKQTSEKLNSVSLLRRASIQCEAVLTQISTPRRIFNPLQDVDINSLRSPGPLHAVTLQYSNMPMRELPTSKPPVAVPGETPTLPNTHPSPDTGGLNSPVSTNASRTHNFITENDYKSKSLPRSKQFKHDNSRMAFPETSLADIAIKTTSNEHPIPKPRTGILKEVPSQEANSQINSCLASSANRKHNTTLEMLPKSTLQETSHSNHVESGRNNESFTLAGFNSTVQAEQNCSKAQSDNRKVDTVAVYERANHNPQKDLSDQKDCSSVEKTSPDFQVNTGNRRNLSIGKSVPVSITEHNPLTRENVHFPKSRLQTQSNPAKKCNQADCSKLILSSKSQPVHTRDVSVLSDEGYSTCDSISSPQSQPSSVGSLQSCDMGSFTSGSIVNLNVSLGYSSEKDKDSFLKQCTPSTMENYVKHERNLKNNSNKSIKESPRTKGLPGTNKVTTDKFQTYSDHHNRLEHKLCKTSEDKMVYHSYQTQGELAQQTKVTNQQALSKADTEVCSNKVKNKTTETVVKTEKWTEFLEEVVPKLTRSNNPMKDTDEDATKMFKQTSV